MGRHKEIKSPEQMMELFEEYRTDINANPILVHDFVGKDATEVYREKQRPITLVGFYNYCRKNATDVHNYFENTEEGYNDFKGICRAIKDEIRDEQISGGMSGIYNPSITQRLNNLAEKVEQKFEGGIFEKINIDVEE